MKIDSKNIVISQEIDIEFLEKFYAEYEKLSGKPRPVDWVERGTKVLTGQRKPCGWKTEGLAKQKFED